MARFRCYIPISAAALLWALVLVALATPSAGAPSITFDGSVTNQVIDGFGVNINHRSWNDNDLKPVIDALVDQAGMTLFRVIYDKTDWQATNDNSDPSLMDWNYYSQVYSSAEFQKMWALMGYLNQKGISNGLMLNFQGNGPAWLGSPALNTGMEPQWAQMIASLLIYAAKTNNLAFSLVGPDNEMDQTVQGVNMTATQYTNALHILSQDLDSNGMSGLRFVGPDMAAGGTVYMPQMLGDPVVMSKVAHFGLHSYADEGGGSAGVASYIQSTAYSNRTVWMTEFNVWCPQCDAGVAGTNTWSYASGAVAYLCAHLANGVSGGLVWEAYDSQYNYYSPLEWSFWGLFAVDDTNAVNKTYTPRKIFYTLSQLSKWVRPGAQMIGVSGSTWPFSPLQAFYHPGLGQLTIVGINTGDSPAVLSGTNAFLPPLPKLDLYYTSPTANLAYGGGVPITNSQFNAVIPANCVFTLTSDISGSAPPTGSITNLIVGSSNVLWDFSLLTNELQNLDWAIQKVSKGQTNAVEVLFNAPFTQDGRGKLEGQGSNRVELIQDQSGSQTNIFAGDFTVRGSVASSRGVARLTFSSRVSGTTTLAGDLKERRVSAAVTETIKFDVNQNLVSGRLTRVESAAGKGSLSESLAISPGPILPELGNELGNGTWTLSLDFGVAKGNQLSGSATVVLNSGKVYPFSFTGTFTPHTGESRLNLKGVDAGLGCILQVTLQGSQITKIVGQVSGQSVNCLLKND